jgi:hypothetical protein
MNERVVGEAVCGVWSVDCAKLKQVVVPVCRVVDPVERGCRFLPSAHDQYLTTTELPQTPATLIPTVQEKLILVFPYLGKKLL